MESVRNKRRRTVFILGQEQAKNTQVNYVTKDEPMEVLQYFLDNIFLKYVDSIFSQIIGVLIEQWGRIVHLIWLICFFLFLSINEPWPLLTKMI